MLRPYGTGLAQAQMNLVESRKAARMAAVEAIRRGQQIPPTAIQPIVVVQPQTVQSQPVMPNTAAQNSSVLPNAPSASPVQTSIPPSPSQTVQAEMTQPRNRGCLTNPDKLIRGNRKLGLTELHPQRNRRKNA